MSERGQECGISLQGGMQEEQELNHQTAHEWFHHTSGFSLITGMRRFVHRLTYDGFRRTGNATALGCPSSSFQDAKKLRADLPFLAEDIELEGSLGNGLTGASTITPEVTIIAFGFSRKLSHQPFLAYMS